MSASKTFSRTSQLGIIIPLISLTASVIGNFAGFSDWRIATRASREGPGEGDDKTSADGCDRVRHMPFGADRRRLGVGNRREGQIPRRAGCKAVLRGGGAPRSAIRKP